jgi:hypothetical protein
MHPKKENCSEHRRVCIPGCESSPLNHLSGIKLLVARNKLMILAVLVFSAGCAFDHLTTLYGISLPNITEANPVVLQLMELGIWPVTELFIILAGMICGVIISGMESSKLNDFSLNVLAVVGLSRFFAAFNNLFVIVNALYTTCS